MKLSSILKPSEIKLLKDCLTRAIDENKGSSEIFFHSYPAPPETIRNICWITFCGGHLPQLSEFLVGFIKKLTRAATVDIYYSGNTGSWFPFLRIRLLN